MRRIFVGIPISEEIKERVRVWQNKFQFPIFNFQINPKIQISNEQIRFIEPKNLHITLVPPWNEDDVATVKERLLRFARNDKAARPFEIMFNKITLGPNKMEPRMVWAVGPAGPEIIDLRSKMIDLLNQGTEGRPFKLHCTLARFRDLNIERLQQPIDWRMMVDSFVLYESHLSSKGADYEILGRFGLYR